MARVNIVDDVEGNILTSSALMEIIDDGIESASRVYIEGMRLPLLHIDAELGQKVIDALETIEITLIISKQDQSEQDRKFLEKISGKDNCTILEVNRKQILMPNTPPECPPFWGDFACSPRKAIYLLRHDPNPPPNPDEHSHKGFICRNNLQVETIYQHAIEIADGLQQCGYAEENMEELFNNLFYHENLDWLKEEYSDKWVLIMNAGLIVKGYDSFGAGLRDINQVSGMKCPHKIFWLIEK